MQPKAAVILGMSFVAGWWGFSWLWMIVLSAALMFMEYRDRQKLSNRAIAQQRRAVLDLFGKELEVHSESAVWFNIILGKIFDEHHEGMSAWLAATLDPILTWYKPPSVSSIGFSTCELGKEAPVVQAVHTHRTKDQNTIQIDLDLDWKAACNLVVTAYIGLVPLSLQLKNLVFITRLRLTFHLIPRSPNISSIDISFVDTPHIDVTLKPLKGMDLTEAPGVSTWLQELLSGGLAGFMQWPLKYTYDMLPTPKGLTLPRTMRVSVKAGRNLEARNYGGTSDPYVMTVLSNVDFYNTTPASEMQTRVIAKTLEPVWNETLSFFVENPSGQFLTLNVLDKETMGSDQPMGSVVISLKDEMERGMVLKDTADEFGETVKERTYPPVVAPDERWVALTNTGEGELLLKFEFLEAVDGAPAEPVSGKLKVRVIAGTDLLSTSAMGGACHPQVVLHLGNPERSVKSKAAAGNDCEWNETLSLNIIDRERQQLYVRVFDHNKLMSDKEIGDLVLPAAARNESLSSGWFDLNNTKAGKIHLELEFVGDNE